MRIAIIDDEKPARSELKYLVGLYEEEAEFTEISSGEEALEVLKKENFDLLLIDMNLGDISGSALAYMARKKMPETEIVFATALSTYAEKAFEVEALYYLLKPFSGEKVKQMLERYHVKKDRKEEEEEPKRKSFQKIPVTLDKKTLMVDLSEVVYIESQNRVCVIHTKNEDFEDHNTLNYYEERLKDKGFFRIQKSYIVNLRYVSEIAPWFHGTYSVKLSGQKEVVLPVSRKIIKELREELCI